MMVKILELINEWSGMVVSLSSLAVACIAWRGLSVWKQQFNAKENYKLANNILTAVYKWRDSIDLLRSRHPSTPLFSETEAPGTSEEQRLFMGWKKYYQDRYKICSEARQEAYKHLLHADVLWGSELEEILKNIFQKDEQLACAVRDYLENKNPDSPFRDEENLKRPADFILYSDGEDDKFDQELKIHIRAVEDFLKPKLKL